MELIHFSDVDNIDLTRRYEQWARQAMKPSGLWVSNENEKEYGWSQWCNDNDWSTGDYTHKHKIHLKRKHNILTIRTRNQFLEFQRRFSIQQMGCWGYINWYAVVDLYPGILIPKYFWDFRLGIASQWYYTWDCASGCIWDLNSISKITTSKI